MIKSKFAMTLILGACLTLGSSGIAYASTSVAEQGTGKGQLTESSTSVTDAPDATLASLILTSPEENDVVLQKQREVDQYVFEQHKLEISQKGFMVTHTGPLDDFVEIGIEPYSEDNAEYLYEIFGKDKVKVVQGQQAVTLGFKAVGNEVATDGEATVNVASDQKGKTAGDPSSPLPLVYALGGVIVLGVGAIALKRS